ncbi:minor capsid protein [Microbacterium halophytorum]|uniref:minor capsid protein n=1 Tax=Microbacterium halophytorum TaxID=2067568 RepID=UPI000CFD37DE|nr:minor capsid protein [Microbacterium halophytorum]
MDDTTLTRLLLIYLSGVPGWEWRPAGPEYTSAEVGLFYGPIAAAPDRAIGVRVYATEDDRHLSQRRVQIRFRGARGRVDGADQLASTAFAALGGLSRVDRILSATRISMAPLGADTNGRDERTDNYLITLDNLEAS